MAALPDKLSILNRALLLLGDSVVNDPDSPESTAGKAMVSIFDQVRRSVLAKYLWNFAEVTADTNYLDASQSLYDDDYIYPESCLKILKLLDDDGCTITDYRLGFNTTQQAKVIQLDNKTKPKLKLVYTYDMANLSYWSPLAAEVLSYTLALAVSNSILGRENTMAKILDSMLSEELKDAIAVDGQEQPMRVDTIYETEIARHGDLFDYYRYTNVKWPSI